MRRAAQWRVDDQSNLTVLDVVDDVGTTFVHLENVSHFQPDLAQARCRSLGGHQLETQTRKSPRQQDSLAFVRFVDADKGDAFLWQTESGGSHRFAIGFAKTLADAHHLTG